MYRYTIPQNEELLPEEAVLGRYKNKAILLSPNPRTVCDYLVPMPTPIKIKLPRNGSYVSTVFSTYPEVDKAIHYLMGRPAAVARGFRYAVDDADSKLSFLLPSGLSRKGGLLEVHVIQYDKPWDACMVGCLKGIPFKGLLHSLKGGYLTEFTKDLDFNACVSLYDVLLYKHVEGYQVRSIG